MSLVYKLRCNVEINENPIQSITFPQLPVKPRLTFRTLSISAPVPARISQTESSPSIRPALKKSM